MAEIHPSSMRLNFGEFVSLCFTDLFIRLLKLSKYFVLQGCSQLLQLKYCWYSRNQANRKQYVTILYVHCYEQNNHFSYLLENLNTATT